MIMFQSYIMICLEYFLKKYYKLSDLERKIIGSKYDPTNLFLETYNLEPQFENEKSTNTTRKSDKEKLDDLPPLEGDEEKVKKRKRNKNFNFTEIVDQTSNIISTNQSWKQFIKIKK